MIIINSWASFRFCAVSVWPILLLLWVIVYNHVDRPIGAGIVFTSPFKSAPNGLFIFRLNCCSFERMGKKDASIKGKGPILRCVCFFPSFFFFHPSINIFRIQIQTRLHPYIRIIFHLEPIVQAHSTDYFSFFMRFWPFFFLLLWVEKKTIKTWKEK